MSIHRHHQPVLITLLLLLLVLTGLDAYECAEDCQFRQCKSDTGELTPPGGRIMQRPAFITGFGPVVCREDREVGYIVETGEALAGFLYQMPISTIVGVKPAFPPDFFQTRNISALGKSGIVKIQSRGNQDAFVQGMCVSLPIHRYQFMRWGVLRTVDTKRRSRFDCVSFVARTTKLLVELQWTSQDDLDLTMVQPNLEVLSKENRRTTNGGTQSNDPGLACTAQHKVGRIALRYFQNDDVLPGNYTVYVKHFKNCGNGPTDWILYISVDGKLVMRKTGTSNSMVDDSLIREIKFTL